MDDVRSDRRIKETQAHLGLETKETLRIMQEERCDSPVSMRYFFNLFERHSQGGIPVSSAGSGPTVGTLCIHVPEELIYAAGATPVRLCSGSLAYEQAGADLLPAKACPVVKATVGRLQGIALTGAQEFSLIVSPTSCDQKKKMGELLEEFGYRICYLEVPASKDSEEARIYWRRSVQKLARILEKTTGRTITDRRLSRAIAVVRSAQVAYRNLHQVMKSCTPVIRGTDAMLVSHAYFFDDITWWTGAVNSLVEELKERQRSEFGAGNRQAPRILFAGSPPIFPNLKIPLLIELAGGMLVADEVCSSSDSYTTWSRSMKRIAMT